MARSLARRGSRSTDNAWKGLQVVDRRGCEVGKVEFVKLGDPAAVMPSSQHASGDGDLMSTLAEAMVDCRPDLPTKIAERMLRLGFVKVDGSGTTDTDLYIPADEIASIIDGTVRLAVTLDELASNPADLVRPTA